MLSFNRWIDTIIYLNLIALVVYRVNHLVDRGWRSRRVGGWAGRAAESSRKPSASPAHTRAGPEAETGQLLSKSTWPINWSGNYLLRYSIFDMPVLSYSQIRMGILGTSMFLCLRFLVLIFDNNNIRWFLQRRFFVEMTNIVIFSDYE